MTDNEFLGWMLEKRVDLLSERKERPGQEETLDEMEHILEERMKPSQRISMGMLLDKVRWKDEETQAGQKGESYETRKNCNRQRLGMAVLSVLLGTAWGRGGFLPKGHKSL